MPTPEEDFHATYEYEKSWIQPERESYTKRVAQQCLESLRALNRIKPHPKLDAAIDHINRTNDK